VLEGFDLLRHAVFQQLEVGGREIAHRLPVDRGKHVDADEIRFDSEGGLPLTGRRPFLRVAPREPREEDY
jgi:hypothetical protein